jgi:hypothetical protein
MAACGWLMTALVTCAATEVHSFLEFSGGHGFCHTFSNLEIGV